MEMPEMLFNFRKKKTMELFLLTRNRNREKKKNDFYCMKRVFRRQLAKTMKKTVMSSDRGVKCGRDTDMTVWEKSDHEKFFKKCFSSEDLVISLT